MASSVAAVLIVLVVVLLGMGWPAPASAEGKRTACKDCNSMCADTINSSRSECGGICGAPTQECVEKCIWQCSHGCTPEPGRPDSCYRACSGLGTVLRCRSQCCPSPQQCQEITQSAMQQCIVECGATCKKGCGHP